MLKIFSKILFILTLLIFGFFIAHNTEAKSKVKLSKKYRPPGNPGGVNFHADEDFAESYKLYEKRRATLKKRKSQERADIHINKEKLINKLKEKKIISLENESSNEEVCIINNEENTMINQHGINIARLKGAVFVDDSYQGPIFQYQQEEKKNSSAREKKISPINVTIKEALPKGVCSHDSIANLNNMGANTQYSLDSAESFGSVAEVVK
ncbi:TRP75-related protein [Wolbachia endosymbiont (group E) of Neria commutata]|uniref:TRP75-related protein n=1 Tax=Wolbachia endosymbiont (group E) of Neria commutata TaxID=3066149 RepID=UPI003132E0FA